MIGDRIKELREKSGVTQSYLARRLQISRSAVNAWEMGLSLPSAQYLVELASYFNVSTDYILEIDSQEMINITFLSEPEKEMIYRLLKYFKHSHALTDIIKKDPTFRKNEDLMELLHSGEL